MSAKKRDSSRRDFIKVTGLSATYITAGGLSLQGCLENDSPGFANELFKAFINPHTAARPFFRWWWNGNNVTKEEISRELEIIKNSGAGGVEINPIAMPEQIENEGTGLVWLSDEWCNMLVHTVDECKRLDLITDLIVGTGWPFGGEFIDPEETLQGMTFDTIELKGNGTRPVKIDLPKDDHEKIIKILLIPEHLDDMKSIKVLTEDMDKSGVIRIDLSSGNFLLMTIRWRNKFRTVFQGAPGGAGSVLDHFNQKAVRKYLENMSEKVKSYFDGDIGNGIRSIFCDSIELAGANWTDDLEKEFQKRRGYDIEPYLPLIHFDKKLMDDRLQDEIRRVRYDFSLTLAELFMERFIEPYHDWCRENNTLSRYQAYGHPWLYTDMIDGFMIPDIPEGDQWLYNPGWSLAKIDEIRYGIWNKYASSGAHLAGKKIASSEAMTNTSGVFRASLEYIKQATDLNFVAGINHLVLHGFNYSPPEAGFPGWVRYGCYFNENNTWWDFFPLWADYASRISAVLQYTYPVSQVAIMGPTSDVWSDSGLDRNPYNMTPWYLHSFWQALNHNGICSDYVNPNIIKNADVADGKLLYGQMSYDTLILCNTETIDPGILNKIFTYISAGLNVVFIGNKPSFSPGLMDSSDRDKQVKGLCDKIFKSGAFFIEAPNQKKIDPYQGLSNWTCNLIEKCQIKRGISIFTNGASLFFVQRKYEDLDIFFFCNSGQDKSLDIKLNFEIQGKKVWQWCPETLTRKIVHQDSGRQYHLALSPLESVLLVLDPSGEGTVEVPEPVLKNSPLKLEGKWEVNSIHNINHSKFNIGLNELVDLSNYETLKDFSGEIIYTLKFDLDITTYKQIDPGEVYDIAEISINGKSIGTRWWGKLPALIPDGLLKQDGNLLVIKVYNRLYNYCASLSDNPVADYWVKRNRHQSNLPAGLIGPVILS
jgi:hypothetical protein